MITIFCDFCPFSAKKLAFFSKTNVTITFYAKLPFVRVKNGDFIRQIFQRIKKIITSTPGHPANESFFRFINGFSICGSLPKFFPQVSRARSYQKIVQKIDFYQIGKDPKKVQKMIARRIFFGVWSSFEKSGKLEPREPILRS
jgi:hypothetical protein